MLYNVEAAGKRIKLKIGKSPNMIGLEFVDQNIGRYYTVSTEDT
jgi:hypothetical protein